MRAAVSLWWRLRSMDREHERLPGLLAVAAFAVATAALLVCVSGLGAFEDRASEPLGALRSGDTSVGEVYVTLAWIATTCMVVPIATLGGVAARLSVARRNARLAALRLVGATSAQVVVMTLAEAAMQALVGALGGVLLWTATLPLLTRLSFQGRQLSLAELLVSPAAAASVVAGTVVLSVLSGLSSLARVVVSPLGVAARTTPRRLSVLRVLVAVAAGMAWFLVIGAMKRPERVTIVVLLAAFILALNAVGPFVVMWVGRLVARFAPGPGTLLAARRISDDPRSTWRAVGALGLAIVVVGFTNLTTAEQPGNAVDTLLERDLGTGALVTLAVITVVGATSTGVVQAARVLDQRAQYRSLALAGTGLPMLHRARNLEIGLPLAVTVGLSAGFVLVLMLPFSSMLQPALVVRYLVAVAAASAVMLGAVRVSRRLVRSAAAV